ncbi:MAG: zf-HC2 domain-containing protein [Gemmatimonadales bacterium]
MSDQWTDRLSEYLDDELGSSERAQVEAHLRECTACAAALADLRRIAGRARAMEDRPPARDLWPGIAARIGSARGLRRFSLSLTQLAAAGITLMVLSGGAAWVLHPGAQGGSGTLGPAPAGGAPTVSTVAGPRPTPAQSYGAAVADLERVLAAGRGRLDSATVRVIEQNLATIDQAIAQAQRAVAADSANLYLNSHLVATMRRKLDLLRQAAALVSAVS